MEDDVKRAKQSWLRILLAALLAVVAAVVIGYWHEGERGWSNPLRYVVLVGLLPFGQALFEGWLSRREARLRLEKKQRWLVEFGKWKRSNLPKEKLRVPPRIRPASSRRR